MKILINIFYYLFLFFLLIILSPVILIISICMIIFSGFPILYKQTRVGKQGKPFLMYKFRTMTVDADKMQQKLIIKNEADGPVFKIHDDPRFTRIGKFLSHTGLDELPQLINIVKSDMALIGPRPLPVDEVAKLTKWQKRRHNIKPGIISPWIFDGYHERTFNEWMMSDIRYIQNKSLWTDLILLEKTLLLLFRLILKETKDLSIIP